jgi:hypothetical protein
MAVLAWDFVNPRMHTMAERDGLIYIGTRRPWSLRKCDCSNSTREQEQSDGDYDAVHRRFFRSGQ